MVGEDRQVELYAPALLPELCAIANGSRGHGSEARRRAFSVLRTFIGTLGLMASQKENRAKAESMLAPTLPAWLAAMTAVLATPRADDGDHAAVALQLEVLRSLTARKKRKRKKRRRQQKRKGGGGLGYWIRVLG